MRAFCLVGMGVLLVLTGSVFGQAWNTVTVPAQGNHTQFNDPAGWTHYSGGGSAWANGGLGWSPVDPMVGTASDTANKPWAPAGSHINYGHTGQVLESIYNLSGNATGGASITGTFSLWGYNSSQHNGGASIMGLGLGNGVNVSIEPVLDSSWNLNQPFLTTGAYNGTNYIGDGAYHWMAVLHNNQNDNPIALLDLGTFAPAGYGSIDHGEYNLTTSQNVWHTATLSLKSNGTNDDVEVVWDGVSHKLPGIYQLSVYGNNDPLGTLSLNQATFGFGTQEQRDNNNGTFLSFDSVSVGPALPEPASLCLLALGALALLRRRG